jgi:hypothetical protein
MTFIRIIIIYKTTFNQIIVTYKTTFIRVAVIQDDIQSGYCYMQDDIHSGCYCRTTFIRIIAIYTTGIFYHCSHSSFIQHKLHESPSNRHLPWVFPGPNVLLIRMHPNPLPTRRNNKHVFPLDHSPAIEFASPRSRPWISFAVDSKIMRKLPGGRGGGLCLIS